MTALISPASGGGWLAFVSGPRLLALAPSDEHSAEAVWAALATTGGFQSALDLLTSRGLAATPSFVLVEWENGGARVIVRGEITLTVQDAAGSHDLTGSSVSTWVERTVAGVISLALVIRGATEGGPGPLPLESGVVFAAGLRWSAARAPAGDVPATDVEATVAEPPEMPPTGTAPTGTAPTGTDALETDPTPTDPTQTLREVTAPPVEPANVEPVNVEPVNVEPASVGPASLEPANVVAADTMHRSVTEVPDREPATPAEGDHDGRTVLSSNIAKLRGQRKARSESSPVPPPAEPPPAKLVLVVSTTGAREPLTQPILVGRSPSVAKIPGARIPRLLTIGADQDISRNHAQIALEGGTVVVTDLHSKNGTSVVLPGSTPQKLRAGEPTAVIVGTVVDLGGGITLTVDEDS